MYDVIVIGAGPAGLQSALTLGRMHRSALILDSGDYRNGTVDHMHNVVADDGTPPESFRARARGQLAEYPDVQFRTATVARIAGAVDDFTVMLSDGSTEYARRIILATGVVDDLPRVAGLDTLWGRQAFACPFCDGHEFAGSEIGVIGAGPRAGHLLTLLGPMVGAITVFSVDAAEADDEREGLEATGARVAPDAVTAVRSAEGGGVIVTAGAADFEFAGLFVAAGSTHQRADFIDQLQLRILDSGSIEIDDFGRTSTPGIFAAGDLAHRASMPGPMPSVIQAAAAGQLAASFVVQELSAPSAS